MAVPSFMADLSLGQAGWSGGFVDSWNRILAIGKAQPALGPRSADMRLRPGGPIAGWGRGPADGQLAVSGLINGSSCSSMRRQPIPPKFRS
jgi:hypothetical protein